MRRPLSSKPGICTDAADVDAAGISVKVTRLTLGGLQSCHWLPASQGVGMGLQTSAEAIQGRTGRGWHDRAGAVGLAYLPDGKGAGSETARVDQLLPSRRCQRRVRAAGWLGTAVSAQDPVAAMEAAVHAGEDVAATGSVRKQSMAQCDQSARCPVVWEDGGGNPVSYPILEDSDNRVLL